MAEDKMTIQFGSKYGSFRLFDTEQAGFGRYGWYINGWAMAPDGELKYYPGQVIPYADISSYAVSSCVHMYALWKKNSYYVTTVKVPEECSAELLGEGSYEYLSVARISAGTDDNYGFIAWNFPDGTSADNPVEFQVLSSVQLTAEYKDLRTIKMWSIYASEPVWRYKDLPSGTAGVLIYRYMDSNEELQAPYEPFAQDNYLSDADNLYGLSVFDDEISALGAYSFAKCKSLTYVSCDTAEVIGKSAFAGCGMLESVSLRRAGFVGSEAFEGCSSMVSASFPELSVVSEKMFTGCVALSDICLPNAKEIGASAFVSCFALSSLDLPEVSSFGSYAFTGNPDSGLSTAISRIYCPNLVEIGEGSFYGCDCLENVDGVQNAKSVGDLAFYGCSNFKRFNFMSAETVGNGAFGGCEQLTSVALHNVNSIGEAAFLGCTQLKIIDFGYSPGRVMPGVVGDASKLFSRTQYKIQCYVPYDYDTYVSCQNDPVWGAGGDLSDFVEIMRGRPPVI